MTLSKSALGLAVAALAFTAAPALAKTKPAAAPATAPAPPPGPVSTYPVVPPATTDVIDTLAARGNFKTFLKLMDAADLTPTIHHLPSITVFAPTDAAFAALAPGIVDGWMTPENKDGLQRLMLYHVVNTKLTPEMIIGHASPIATGAGSSMNLDGNQGDGRVHVDAATVTDVQSVSNGELFVVDKVLAPR